MNEENKTICPECNNCGLVKLISVGGGIIIAGREANQYSDIKVAKYWRDKNGVRHRVTSADGYSTSGTVNNQTSTSKEVKDRIKKDRKKDQQKRMNATMDRANAWNKEQFKKAY